MSVYATFFVLHDDGGHERSCARHVPAKEGDELITYWFDGDETTYDRELPCTCSALRGPYVYEASNKSIEGPDHPRSGDVHFSRAVGTWTLRLGIEDETVLLDRRQVEAMRDALSSFLDRWDDPALYHREDAYDAALPTPELLKERDRQTAEFEAFLRGLQQINQPPT